VQRCFQSFPKTHTFDLFCDRESLRSSRQVTVSNFSPRRRRLPTNPFHFKSRPTNLRVAHNHDTLAVSCLIDHRRVSFQQSPRAARCCHVEIPILRILSTRNIAVFWNRQTAHLYRRTRGRLNAAWRRWGNSFLSAWVGWSVRSAGHEKPRELRYPQRVNELYKTTGRPPTDYRFMLLKDFRRCKRVPNPKFSMLLLRINYAVHCCCGFCLNGAFSGLFAIPFATRTSSQKGFCVTGYWS